MSKLHSVFQGDKDIINTVAKALDYPLPQEWMWFNSDIYHQAFFYLYKRFGEPNSPYDEHKEAGAWRIECKGVTILIRFTSWIEFWVMSDSRDYWDYALFGREKARQRKLKDFKSLAFMSDESDKDNIDLHRKELKAFLKLHPQYSILNVTDEFAKDWWEYVDEYNKEHSKPYLAGLKPFEHYQDLEARFGKANSKHRRLLKVLHKVIRNFVTNPIWIRDVPHNIKGVMADDELKRYNQSGLEINCRNKGTTYS